MDIEKTNDADDPIEVTADERRERAADALEAKVQARIAAAEAELLEKAAAKIDAALQPRDEERKAIVPTDDDGRVSPELGRVQRTDVATAGLYRRLDEAEREFRTPEADHHVAAWLRAHMTGDYPGMAIAEAGIEKALGREWGRSLGEGGAGAQAALASGSGGDLVPRPLEAAVMVARDRVAVLRPMAQPYNMTRQQHSIPRFGSLTVAGAAEGNAPAADDPSIDSQFLVAKKYGVRTLITEELLEDQPFSLVSMLAQRAGLAMGVYEDDQFFANANGSGTNFSGIITGTVRALDTVNVLTYGDLIGMRYTQLKAYRPGSVWFASGNVLEMLAAVTAADGRPLYQSITERPSAIGDTPGMVGTLLQLPVYEAPSADGRLLLTNPRITYAIGSRRGITMKQSDHVAFDNDQISVKFTARGDGAQLDNTANAGVLATGITSAT